MEASYRLAAIALGIASSGGFVNFCFEGTTQLAVWDVSTIGNQGLTEIAYGFHELETLDLTRCSLIWARLFESPDL